MSIIRVRQVADGEELVLVEEFFEARLGLGQADPRAVTLERRHRALSEAAPAPGRASADTPRGRRLRAKANDWRF